MICVERLTVAITPQRKILDNISLTLTRGHVHFIIGPNGSGKTSLLKSLVGLYRSDYGSRIEIAGRDVYRMTPRERAILVSYVESQHMVPFAFSTHDTIAWGRFIRHGGTPQQEDLRAVEKAAAMMGITSLLSKPVTDLSTGERKKTYIAQSLASGAKYFTWDEPLASLDPKACIQLMELVRDLASSSNATFVISCHDLGLALRYGDTINVLDHGQLKWHGPSQGQDALKAIENVFAVTTHRDGLQFS